ncbi:MAG TPA: chemotaxis protein CheW [Thermodesulfobacteriota bacterium]|nr:chemotaxis protein CheW [Thermodesulfobacteriota bacterium]
MPKQPKAQQTVLAKAQDAQGILEERARLLARLPEKKAASGETLEVLTFHLGTEYIGIPTEGVHEIQPLSAHNWSRVPCAPDFIVGIVNLRSRIYSIMDLTVFWGLPPRPLSDKAHLLLLKGGHRSDHQEMELTLLTDDLDKVCHLRMDDLNPVPPTVSAKVQGHLRGVTPDMMMVLDLESLLSDPNIIVCEGE